jgi:hypothetical protein
MSVAYSPSDVIRYLKDPPSPGDVLRWTNRRFNHTVYARYYSTDFDVMERDFDTLIILDGCRYDVFRDSNPFSSEPECIVSPGAHSREFIRTTFAGKQLHDTVYVTSNPWSEQLEDDVFFATRTTYSEDNRGGRARLPADVTNLALETFKRYPNKRYIVHFMQPNNPYVGPKAEAVRERLRTEEGIHCSEMAIEDAEKYAKTVPNLRRALKHGYISQETMFDVYTENLEIVADYAKTLIDELSGKTAITADHGDMFGEPLAPLNVAEYSHWRGVYSDELRNVPWLTVESSERRMITEETPRERDSLDDAEMKDHLRSMGYLDA